MKRIILSILLSAMGTYMAGQPLRLKSDTVLRSPFDDTYQVQPPQIIPSSPQSWLFEKYINHEIAEYNGMPVIEIPLYEIEIKGLKIPITLSYHAGGIKYMEYDGDVAAGWTVNAGGYRISRTIRGKADERYPFYNENDFNSWLTEASTKQRSGYLSSIAHDANSIDEFMNWCFTTSNCHYLDGEYDHFTYMIPGGGGQFLIADRDNRSARRAVGTNPQDKIVLANTTNLSLDDMSITDANGFIYYMGKHPVSSDILSEGPRNTPFNKTGWPLRQIKSPYNETVEFNYINYDVSHDRTDLMSDDYYTFLVRHASKTNLSIGGLLDATTESYVFSPSLERSYGVPYETCFISEIRTDKEIVEFVRYRPQTYTASPYVLKEIKIKTLSGSEIKKISFFYDNDHLLHRLLEKITVDDYACTMKTNPVIQEKQFHFIMLIPAPLF